MGQIPVDTDLLEDLIEANEEDLRDLFSRLFETVPVEVGTPVDEMSFLRPQDFLAALRSEKVATAEIQKLKAWMERRLGVRYARIGDQWGGENRERRYIGVRLKPSVKAQLARETDSPTRF
jgi:hypothetical protein